MNVDLHTTFTQHMTEDYGGSPRKSCRCVSRHRQGNKSSQKKI